ncbi:hypothetical protein HAX54_019961 [Datura stramonium]|uniref:Uncharacterized protein n=1 Tax=Datura stramonium TaxID=4076 RepID=A0ABS8USF3_DATST|nr:hypothetical protein [Datura stramonium]
MGGHIVAIFHGGKLCKGQYVSKLKKYVFSIDKDHFSLTELKSYAKDIGASQLEEGINKIVNEAAVVDNPVLDFEEEDLDGIPDEDDNEVDEELRGFRENLRQQKRNNEVIKQKQKIKNSSKIQEVELGEAGVDRGFEDIFKNKVDKYAGRLGGDKDFIGSSDELSKDSEEELDVLAQPCIDLPSRRKSRKSRYDDSSVISFFELDMIFESAIEFRKVVTDYAIQEKGSGRSLKSSYVTYTFEENRFLIHIAFISWWEPNSVSLTESEADRATRFPSETTSIPLLPKKSVCRSAFCCSQAFFFVFPNLCCNRDSLWILTRSITSLSEIHLSTRLQSMGWGNIYKRRVKVFAVALIIYFDYKALQQREKWVNASKKASLWEKCHERNARRVLNLIVKLEGLWVKLGQYLSTRADVLPEAYTCLLKQLQDALPPRSLKEVCRTIEKELGKTMDNLFLDFDKVPLATASIAQVHRAILSDGQEVVVKVQHDGIKAVILEDLKNAKSIIDWIAWAEPQYNFHPMIDEWCKEAPKELDFNHEAENTQKVSRNLHCNKRCDDSRPANYVDVLIPEVIQSTEKVLILEYMDGVRLNDVESLQALGVDKQKLVEEITRAYAHQIYVDGFFNGDPHPGNFLVSKEPPHRPILLDFGLTKLLSSSLKQALAKMFLAAAEGDHVALLAAFAEMGLKFRLDVPEQAMEVTSVFFRSSTPSSEALESMKMLSEQRSKNLKVIQEKMKLNEKEVKRFNPVDAFPSDIVIFGRVLNLLRGLSATMNVRIVYIDIMRPFAESVLQCNLNTGPALNPRWVYDTPIHSDVEAKLRQLLVELGNAEKILGIQVCAYKDGEVIIDTAAGVLGKYDPRPVQPDSLFSVFSVTKGICAGLMHWLVDNGKLKLEENVANIWPEFGSNGKDQIKVHHVLNHTSGLHNAMNGFNQEDPFLMTDWDECLKRIAMSAPETTPGHEQLYHYLSFGWLCGGIIERASGRRFQELLEEVLVRPLKIDGELYVGIPPGMIICLLFSISLLLLLIFANY